MTEELKKEQEATEEANSQSTEEKVEKKEKVNEGEQNNPNTGQQDEQETADSNADENVTEETDSDAGNEKAAADESNDEESIDAVTEEDVRVAPEEEEVAVFSGDVDEEVYTYDQLEEASEDYSDEEYHEMADRYSKTLKEIDEKEIVTGTVVSADDEYVIVDIGFKSEGVVYANEFPTETLENLAPGDEIDVFLDEVEDREGQLNLSRRKADILHAWNTIQDSSETGEVLEGHIERRIKGGMVANIMGIEAFLPGSQIDVRPVRDFDAYVGRTMEFQVVKLNMPVENVVISHRALIESDLEEQREQILETIEEGQVLEGIVKNITDFGVFIDLGGVDGLLHITDLSWGRVDHPSEILSLDQHVNVAVIDYDDEKKRVSLGLKQLQPEPWTDIDIKYPEGMKVQGRVVSIADYGAFIELEKGIEGLIHISEMSWTQHIQHPSQLVNKNDIVECVVLNVNEEERKISLGIKQLENDPWKDIEERYPIGSKHTGTVRNLTNFGVFVELEPGIDGLIHISDLSWTEQIKHPKEVVTEDEEIEVAILSIDYDNRRITLGHKQIERNPWEAFAEEYPLKEEVEGEVIKTTDKGVFLLLPHELEGFVPASKTEAGENPSEYFEKGDKVEAFVMEFNETNHNITLTQNEDDLNKVKSGSKSRAPKQERPEAPETGTPTLGEMSGLGDLQREMESEQRKKAEAKLQEEAKKEEENSDEEE
ncbi:MAG TPA: 30S ribosomal protein S1 [Balneolaceae bacterium]|nr:30S ribosomal protein S1 [Balneolaceae bacterium]